MNDFFFLCCSFNGDYLCFCVIWSLSINKSMEIQKVERQLASVFSDSFLGFSVSICEAVTWPI